MPGAAVERSTVVSFCHADESDVPKTGPTVARSGSVPRIRAERVAKVAPRVQWDGEG